MRGRALPALRSTVAAGALAALLALAGCADTSSQLLTTSGPPISAPPGSTSGDAAAAYGGATASPAARFDPFATDGFADRPLREVIANPTLAEVLQPGPLPEFSLGSASAPVVMVKYMSLTCPHCRRFMADTFPALKRDYIDTGKVRLVIREFPIGRTSGNATIALRCAPMDKYLTLYRKFLDQQAVWVSQEVRPEAIMKVASQVGMTRDQYDACVRNQPMITALNAVKDRGRQLGIIGTPNFFIGNRLVKSVLGIAEIRAIVDPMLTAGGRAATAKAG
jgi:protein-disulfide isomerase